MPLVAAAVCPHPPLLVPEVAGAAAAELDELRAACDTAVLGLLSAQPEVIVVVGAASGPADFGPADHGSLRPYGVDIRAALPPAGPAGRPGLPLSLLLGAWLLGRAGADRPCHGRAVGADEPPTVCAAVGETVAGPGTPRVGLLVMGDGTACRGEKAPGYDDPRAREYDDAVANALAGADVEGLLGLDVQLSGDLRVAGRPAWQVLAGAARASGGRWRGDLSYAAAPYGVGYFVAGWTR